MTDPLRSTNSTKTSGLLRLQWAAKLTPAQAAAVSAGLSSRQLTIRAGYLTAPFSYVLRVVVTEYLDGERMLSNSAQIRVTVSRLSGRRPPTCALCSTDCSNSIDAHRWPST